MKFTANILVTSALAATLLTMVACAPATSGKRFKDRGGAHNKVAAVETEDSKILRDRIVSIEAKVESATEHQESQDKIKSTIDQYKAEGVSGLDRLKKDEQDEADGTQALRSRQPRMRDEYIMSVRINVAGEGHVELVGINDSFGDSTALQTLSHLNKDCAKTLPLKVRAGCYDSACDKLIVEITKLTKPTTTVTEILSKKKDEKPSDSDSDEPIPGDLKVIIFEELDREEDLAKRKVKVEINKSMASCKGKVSETQAKPVEPTEAEVEAAVAGEAKPKAKTESAANVLEDGLI